MGGMQSFIMLKRVVQTEPLGFRMLPFIDFESVLSSDASKFEVLHKV
jgi:hypothetical protein